MTVQIPPGMPSAVNLLLTKLNGSDEFHPAGAVAASGSGTGYGVPTQVFIQEAATSASSVTRARLNANGISTQVLGITTAATTINGLNVINTPYPYDPATTSIKDIIRATGGGLNVVNPIYSEGAITNDDGIRAGQDVRAFLYAEDDTDPLQAVRLIATAAGALRTSGGASTTITTVADQTGVGTTATSLAAANTGRTSVIVQNIGATNQARVGDTNITITRGVRLAPGESVTFETTAQIFGLSEASTTDFAVTELE